VDWRLRGIPPPLWRIVCDKAGPRLQEVLIGLLRAYADGEIDPLAPPRRSLDVVATTGGKVTIEQLEAQLRELQAQVERNRAKLLANMADRLDRDDEGGPR
jgi:hypothetical protein